jgi:hypothetical protein
MYHCDFRIKRYSLKEDPLGWYWSGSEMGPVYPLSPLLLVVAGAVVVWPGLGPGLGAGIGAGAGWGSNPGKKGQRGN